MVCLAGDGRLTAGSAGDGRDDADVCTGLLECCVLFDVELEKAGPPFGAIRPSPA